MGEMVKKKEISGEVVATRVLGARAEKTREEILVVARLMVEKHGFSKLTLDDIAGYMGKRKGFLYYYFKDKEALLATMIDREMAIVASRTDAAVAKARTGLEKVEIYMGTIFEALEERKDLILALHRDQMESEMAAFYKVLEKARLSMFGDIPLVEGFLRQGVVDGSIRAMDEEMLLSIARVLVLGVNGVVYGHLVSQWSVSPRRVFEIGYVTLLEGLSPRGGGAAKPRPGAMSSTVRKVFELEELRSGAFR